MAQTPRSFLSSIHQAHELLPLQPRPQISRNPMPITLQAPRLTSPALPPPTAARLLRGKQTHLRGAYAVPWGVQRIYTYIRVVELAFRAKIPVPPIADDDIRAFFSARTARNVASHQVKSFAPPVEVDVRLLGKIRITAEEILTFFPLHIKWNDCIYRLVQNGWKQTDIAGYINYARQPDEIDHVRANSIIRPQQGADETILGSKKQGVRHRPNFKTTCYTAERWVLPQKAPGSSAVGLRVNIDPIDYFLVDLADGVENFPEGDGARLLTRAVLHAIEYDHDDVKLSEISTYAQTHGLGEDLNPMAINGLKDGQHPDVASRLAVAAKIENGRNRPKRVKKRGAQDEELTGKAEHTT